MNVITDDLSWASQQSIISPDQAIKLSMALNLRHQSRQVSQFREKMTGIFSYGAIVIAICIYAVLFGQLNAFGLLGLTVFYISALTVTTCHYRRRRPRLACLSAVVACAMAFLLVFELIQRVSI